MRVHARAPSQANDSVAGCAAAGPQRWRPGAQPAGRAAAWLLRLRGVEPVTPTACSPSRSCPPAVHASAVDCHWWCLRLPRAEPFHIGPHTCSHVPRTTPSSSGQRAHTCSHTLSLELCVHVVQPHLNQIKSKNRERERPISTPSNTGPRREICDYLRARAAKAGGTEAGLVPYAPYPPLPASWGSSGWRPQAVAGAPAMAIESCAEPSCCVAAAPAMAGGWLLRSAGAASSERAARISSS